MIYITLSNAINLQLHDTIWLLDPLLLYGLCKLLFTAPTHISCVLIQFNKFNKYTQTKLTLLEELRTHVELCRRGWHKEEEHKNTTQVYWGEINKICIPNTIPHCRRVEVTRRKFFVFALDRQHERNLYRQSVNKFKGMCWYYPGNNIQLCGVREQQQKQQQRGGLTFVEEWKKNKFLTLLKFNK